MSSRRLRRAPRESLPVVLLLLFGAVSADAQQKAEPAQDELARVNESIDALTKKVWPSVVQILVNSYGARDRWQGRRGQRRRGPPAVGRLGIRHRRRGLHPDQRARRERRAARADVLPADNADGTLATALSGRMKLVQARIVGIATELDLALLKVDGLKLPALPLATYSQLRQGETVFAFGSPLGLRNSLTHGLVSAVARQVDPDSPAIYVQTDAPINPGNSGGPLVNIRGEVVGINTFILSQGGGDEGLGFAIPSATARTAFRQLKQFGHLRRQEVGMSMQTITPAMAAGLSLATRLRRDRVRRLAARPRRGSRLEGRRHPGVRRRPAGGEPADRQLQLPSQGLEGAGEARGPPRRIGGEPEHRAGRAGRRLRHRLGGGRSGEEPRVGAGHPGRGDRLHHRGRIAALRDPFGIIVVAKTMSADTPLQPKDVIRSLNNQQTYTLQALRNVLAGLSRGSAVVLQVQRAGRLIFVSFTLE